MFIPRRVASYGVFLALTATLLAVVSARPPQAQSGDQALSERALRRQFESATDAIRAEDWRTATAALDSILAQEHDVRLTILREQGGKERAATVLVQQEAERLLAALPEEGRLVYEQTYGPRAAADLKEASAPKSAAKLQRVVERYLYTNAGIDALQELATLYHDAGRYDLAALYYERLLRHRGVGRWTPALLLNAAIAFHVADYADSAAVVSRELLDRAGEGASPLGMTRAELQAELDKLPLLSALKDWPLVGGNPARNGRAIGGLPALAALWTQPQARTKEVQSWLNKAATTLAEQHQPALSGAMPLVVVFNAPNGKQLPLAFFRSHWGIHALDLNTGKVKWETPSMWSMDRMVRDAHLKTQLITSWANSHLSVRPNVLLENSTVGTLSTDGGFVYLIDDLDVPPPVRRIFSNPDILQSYGSEDVNNAVDSSKLCAFDLASGKLKWEVGGVTKRDEKPALADSYFLGAPLPRDGNLYVVIERAHSHVPNAVFHAVPNLAAMPDLRDTREVCLAVLEARTGRVQSVLPLFTHHRSMLEEPWRRGQAVHLAYAQGVLVCCAHTGTIVGIERHKNRVLWSHTYRDPRDEPRSDEAKPGWVRGADGRYFDPAFLNQWKVTAPIIADDKVIFTAADASALTCLDLRTGRLLWTEPRAAGDLYLAGVFHGKALIVGNSYVRAVTLADGSKAWQTTTALPSGFGAFTNADYYLPLQSAGPNKEPEICVLDADKGTIVTHLRSPKNAVPGNLVFFPHGLLSLTPTELTGLPLVENSEALLKQLKNATPEQRQQLEAEMLERLKEPKMQPSGDEPSYVAAPRPGVGVVQSDRALRRQLEAAEDAIHAENWTEAAKLLDSVLSVERDAVLTVMREDGDKERPVDAAADPGELFALPQTPQTQLHLDVWARTRLDELLPRLTAEQRKPIVEELKKREKRP